MVENFILDRTPSAILNNLNILRKTGLIIYGGGKIAIHIIETCKREDIKIYDVWDINAEKLKVCNGLNITKPNFNKYNIFQKKDIPVLVTIFSQNGFLKCISFSKNLIEKSKELRFKQKGF